MNGLLIAYGRIVPFIVTLAMLISAQGLAERISGRRSQIVTDPTIAAIANTRLLGIPLLVYIFAAVVAIGWVVLNRTTFGRRTFAIGGNPEAARLAGLDVRRHTVALYVVSGLCCGIAAIMIASLTTTGSSTHGTLYELDAIAAVIIGGTLLSGGRGTLIGSILGVLVFTTITNLFVLNNLATEVQNIAKGAIIVAAVLIQSRARRSDPPPADPPRARPPDRRSSSMSESLPLPDVRRRGLLIGALGLGAGAALTACTSNTPATPAPTGNVAAPAPAGGNAEPGAPVTIGFSAPAADHGWIAAIANNAQTQAGQYPDVTFEAVNPTNDIAQQIAAIETLINKKVSALVAAAQRRQPAHLDRPQGHGRRHPGDQPGPDLRHPAGLPDLDRRRQLRHGRQRRHLHRRADEGQGRGQPDHRGDRRDRQPAAHPGTQQGLRRRAGRRRAVGRPAAGRRLHRAGRAAGHRQPAAGRAPAGRGLEPRRRPGHRRAGRDHSRPGAASS